MRKHQKKGIATGEYVIHPFSGEEIPIWIANFVLMDYGSGAVMAVPGHDQRDWEFATQYGLPIKPVINLTTMIQTTTLVNKHGARKQESQSILDSLTILLLSKLSKQSPTLSKISVSDE